jgi:hypothetical protein
MTEGSNVGGGADGGEEQEEGGAERGADLLLLLLLLLLCVYWRDLRRRRKTNIHGPFCKHFRRVYACGPGRPSPPRSLVRDGQTSPHRPRLVVSRSACPLFWTLESWFSRLRGHPEGPIAVSRMRDGRDASTILLPPRVCVFITAGPIIKLCAWGEGDSGGHVL